MPSRTAVSLRLRGELCCVRGACLASLPHRVFAGGAGTSQMRGAGPGYMAASPDWAQCDLREAIQSLGPSALPCIHSTNTRDMPPRCQAPFKAGQRTSKKVLALRGHLEGRCLLGSHPYVGRASQNIGFRICRIIKKVA